MSIMANRMKDIPQRNKDLTNGFIRLCMTHLRIIPQIIWYLITFYINDNDEEFVIHTEDGHLFDELNVGLMVTPKQVTLVIPEICFENAIIGFRNNVSNKGVHTWTVSINHMCQSEAISKAFERHSKGFLGLVAWNVENDNALRGSQIDMKYCSGLCWDINGNQVIYNPGPEETKGYTMTERTARDKIETVTMKFDCNNYSVDFKINNEAYLNVFPNAKLIKHSIYKAMLCVKDVGGLKCIYKLEQYQQTY